MKIWKQVSKQKKVPAVYVCSRCIKTGAEVPMIEGAQDPDMGRTMVCPVCHWKSRRPVNAVPEDYEEGDQ